MRVQTRSLLWLGAVGLALFAAPHLAEAQSSLGIGVNEPTAAPTGPLGGVFGWIASEQERFGRMLNRAVAGMREESSNAWIVIAISFAYGVLHAAGPGHGKAVISSYMLANEVALRRGVMLSFVSAFAQAVTAILMVGALFLVLRGTAVSMTDATRFLEIASYALITLFGAWLLWRKAGPSVRRLLAGAPAHSLSAAHAHAHGHGHDHHGHAHGHDHGHVHDEHCGHAHAPDPALLSGERFEWRGAWAAVAAVGIRPCTGALLVLTFAFLNGLWVGGLVSVFAMALGTAITVSALATLAVTAKAVAVRLAGVDGGAGQRVHAAIEIGGAALVFLLGLTLLTASLS